MKVAVFVSLVCAVLAILAYAIGDRFVSVADSSSHDVAITIGPTRTHSEFHSETAGTPSADRTAHVPEADKAASQRVVPPSVERLKNADQSRSPIRDRAQTTLNTEAVTERRMQSPAMERVREGDPVAVRNQPPQSSERQSSSFGFSGGRTARNDIGGAQAASKARAPVAEQTRASADPKGESSKTASVGDGDSISNGNPRKAGEPSNGPAAAFTNATAAQPPAAFANEDYMTYEHHLYRAQVGRRAYAQEASELGLEQARLKALQNP